MATIIEFLLDLMGYGFARRLVPAVSCGAVSVERWSSTTGGFNWAGIKRREDGGYVLSAIMASLLGGMFCFVALAFAVTAWRVL